MAYNLLPSSSSRKRILQAVVSDLPAGKCRSYHCAPDDAGLHYPQQQQPHASYGLERQVVDWNRAWHTAIAFLTFPDKALRLKEDQGELSKVSKRWLKRPPSQAVIDSIKYIKSRSTCTCLATSSTTVGDLQLWFCNEIRRHFVLNFRPSLIQLLSWDDDEVLHKLVMFLKMVQHTYIFVFDKYLSDDSGETSTMTSLEALTVIHGLFNYALPIKTVSRLIKREVQHLLAQMLRELISDNTCEQTAKRRDPTVPDSSKRYEYGCSSTSLDTLLNGLLDVGLLKDHVQEMLAETVDGLVTEVVEESYGSRWQIQEHLGMKKWLQDVFAPAVSKFESIMNPQSNMSSLKESTSWTVLKLGHMAFARLGSLHVNKLFDLIADQDQKSLPLDCLRSYVTTPLTRFYLTSSFNAMLKRKLLQPGISTLEILKVYVSMIKVFRQLDPRAVLLDKVARPIRRFLREREDTAKIIVSGLMADLSDRVIARPMSNAEADILDEISLELSKVQSEGLVLQRAELDWNKTDWTPDPIDAAPDHKQSENPDIIGSLISLFENKETFVTELQKILSERLLGKDGNHERERSLLHLLRLRFGDTALQSCEVMLRDIADSKQLNDAIHLDSANFNEDTVPDFFRSRILSYMYWPHLPTRDFSVPLAVQNAQQTYAHSYERVKHARKLAWVQSFGRAVVELELEDRIFRGEVTTWQAAVIFAFENQATDRTICSRNVIEISKSIKMSPALVRSACLFWTTKRVLRQLNHDTFQVLETLAGDIVDSSKGAAPDERESDTTRAADAAVAEADAEAEAETTTSKMNLYWQFIVGMLTNQGVMPLNQIIMMLKIVVPGGFPFSNEELRDFLGNMVSQGKLEIARGGAYKLVAK
ncbi:hypothetical protein KEM54_004766 [Ascosphaera aggregata]|nr:hypothetical protein KEM54_004766 [Ascosphaera aggregata]